MAINSPQQLLALKLQHIQDAETLASEALGDLRRLVENHDLQQLIDRRLQEGREVLQGIRRVLPRLDGHGGGDARNHAARGIIEEARAVLSEVEDPDLQEALAIGSLQALEHYCIATWGTVRALARRMGEDEVVELMERALRSGKSLDQELTRLAESDVNRQALEEGRRGDAKGRRSGPQAQA